MDLVPAVAGGDRTAGSPGKMMLPPGDRILRDRKRPAFLVLTSAPNVNLGRELAGRHNDFIEGTRLVINASGLSPALGFNDAVISSCTNSNVLGYGTPEVGATSVSVNLDGFVLDRSRGDDVLLLVRRASSPEIIRAWARPSSYTSIAGQLTTATAVFRSDPPELVAAFAWQRGKMARHLAEMALSESWHHQHVTIGRQQMTYNHQYLGTFSTVGDLAKWSSGNDFDEQIQAQPYSNPYGSIRRIVRTAILEKVVERQLGPIQWRLSPTIMVVDELSLSPTQLPVEPRISPIRNFTVQGNDAFTDAAGISVTPVLAWDPPGEGAANRYRIMIQGFFADGTTDIAWLVVPGRTTKVRIPPDVLDPRARYVFIVAAVATDGNPETTPFSAPIPYSHAEVLSAAFSTGPQPF